MTTDEPSGKKEYSADIKKEETLDNGGKHFLCSCRFALIVISFFGTVNTYAQRVNMSVAIVCMTDTSNVTSNENCIQSISGTENNSYTCENETMSKQDDRFDWDKKTQGIILGSFFLGYVLSQIPGGWFAAKYGGKLLYGWSMFVCAIATLLTPLAARTSVGLLIVVRAIAGICQGVMNPCLHTLLSFWIPPLQRSTSVAFVYSGTQFGLMAALPLCGFLCVDGFDGGWPSIFYVLGCVGVVWFCIWMFVVSDTPVSHPRISESEKEYIIDTLKSELDINKKSSSTPWSKIFTSLPVWAIIITQTCAEWGAYSFLTNIPSYMNEVLKFDIQKAGFLGSLPYLGFCVVANISAGLADNLRKRGYVSTTIARKIFNSLGNILPAIFIVLMGTVTDDSVIAVTMLTLGLAMSGFQYGSGFMVNPVDIAPRYAGIILAISNTAGSLCGFFAPFAIGFITVDKTREQWKTVFYITAAVYTFGAIIFIMFGSGELQPWARDEKEDREIVVKDEKAKVEVKNVVGL
ncbi:sialin-like [Mercenaria mercenaria]|uniref:sialin-like n=1 Tax=Mercenaria mercenaria TaxID=6596 RepID=UPI00234F9519|nr:sialin-like [Mercenaria mercenaria]